MKIRPKRRKNSKAKGKVGELQWVGVLTDHGYIAQRTQQFKGTQDSFDVESNDPIGKWEVKRRQAMNLHDVVDQAVIEADGELCAVAHRKNKRHWLVAMDALQFFRLLCEITKGVSDSESPVSRRPHGDSQKEMKDDQTR